MKHPDKAKFVSTCQTTGGPFTVICFCNISTPLGSNVAASMSSFFISVENLKSKQCCVVEREVRISCTLRQQPSSHTTFPQSRRPRWDGSGSCRCGSGWDSTCNTHVVLQSTQSHPLAEFSAVLPSVLIPIILLILRSRPLKSCVQPQQSRVFIDETASVAVQLRHAVGLKVKFLVVSPKTTTKGPEVTKVSCFSCRRWVEVAILSHFHVHPAASHRELNFSGHGSNMLF